MIKILKKYQPVFKVRSFAWIFLKQWYSTYRWTHPHEYEGWIIYLVDAGMFTFGFRVKK